LQISINYQIRHFKRNCKLIILHYKTFRERAKKIKYKANETIINDADEFFHPSKIKEMITKSIVVEEVLFEGIMVLGTQIILKWELSKSMTRPKSNNRKV
jgi:hypothetical protein